MKILVIGSGGREHTLCWAFNKSRRVEKIFCANGNQGIAETAECVDILPDDIQGLKIFAAQNHIDLTFVGSENPLALGIVDEFGKHGLKIIGSSQTASQLESSKSFAKGFMSRNNIPTAKYETANSVDEAVNIIESGIFGDKNATVVVKADGLAAGKGVIIAENRREAKKAINELAQTVGEAAAQKIVLEECLIGDEVSVLLFADGKNFALMPPCRDHKRIGEGDTGTNTGGMGTISDAALLSEQQLKQITKTIIEPTLTGAAFEGFPFAGILFLGLMLTKDGIKVLEYNVRFGDPETQVILVRLKTDLLDICEAIGTQTLSQLKIQWEEGSSACVILASKGYPQKPVTGDIIYGLDKLKAMRDLNVFHSGTSKDKKGNFITSGGRVLGVTATGENLDYALKKVYQAVGKIKWDGIQYRRDIGKTLNSPK
jgi:phosphoribosylamine--glycine ligase